MRVHTRTPSASPATFSRKLVVVLAVSLLPVSRAVAVTSISTLPLALPDGWNDKSGEVVGLLGSDRRTWPSRCLCLGVREARCGSTAVAHRSL